MPIYRQPRTSIPAKGHRIYPYLLRNVSIERPNQVWCADIMFTSPLYRFSNEAPASVINSFYRQG
jgi:hypothetical protein